ncbi:MAG TPA: hypothetical protein VJH24_02510 [Candidatus Bilamarchaeaceae archaeon]|nr:hypothetical protein [Candidatus Bilamarchaeaceae archaeon]
MKDVLCDSSSLISLGDSCLDGLLYFLHEKYQIRFIIPPEVENELITRPISGGLKQYYFSALKMKRAMRDSVIVKTPAQTGSHTQEILNAANHMFFIKGKPLALLHPGEAGMLALAQELDISQVLIDERTTRMLIEAPFLLKKHLEEEFGVTTMVNKKNFETLNQQIRNMQVIRSSELLILGYEQGFLQHFPEPREALEAALYKVKFSGCSIGFNEISEFLQSG